MMVRGCLVTLSLVFVVLQGCVAVQSYPVAARAGDTITLAVGSQDNLNRNNITLIYYPNGSVTPVNLTSNIRSIFKVYPDKASRAWFYESSVLTQYAGHGAWQNVIAVDLPVGLTQGAGYFDVILGADVIEPNNLIVQSVSGIQIEIEVLPPSDNPVANDFSHYQTTFQSTIVGNLQWLRPYQRVVLRNTKLSNYNGQDVAAAEYVIKLPINSTVVNLLDTKIANIFVFIDEKPQHFFGQAQLSWSRSADILTVNIISPAGGFDVKSARFEVLVVNEFENVIDPNESLQLISSAYFDMAGNVIVTEASPEVVIMD